jgi:methionine synthase II (cobalamin-independent)
MQRSTDRFLTTHTGSLPRPDDLIRMMYAKEEGVPVEPKPVAALVRTAIAEVVKKQADAGVDLINDGEMSKPSYATYIKDRLDGFGGTGNTFVHQDIHEFPRLEQRVFGDPGRSQRKTPGCNAAISVRDRRAAETDADNLKAALAGVKTAGSFMSPASPGVVSLFFRNDYYKDFESYIYAIADAMRHEYETVAKAGFVLQIDCPDLGMGRHIQYADLSLAEFRKRAQLHVEALNHAVGGATMVPGAALLQAAGVKMTLVPCKGGGPAMRGLLSGDIDFTIAFLSVITSQGDKVRTLVTLADKRVFKDVPTSGEPSSVSRTSPQSPPCSAWCWRPPASRRTVSPSCARVSRRCRRTRPT